MAPVKVILMELLDSKAYTPKDMMRENMSLTGNSKPPSWEPVECRSCFCSTLILKSVAMARNHFLEKRLNITRYRKVPESPLEMVPSPRFKGILLVELGYSKMVTH